MNPPEMPDEATGKEVGTPSAVKRVGRRNRRKWQQWLGRGIFESALIVLSVLLALWANDWRERRSHEAALEVAYHSLLAELSENMELLQRDEYLAHHENLGRRYRAGSNTGDLSVADAIFESGAHPAPLSNSAWLSFVASPVARDLPFDLRMALTRVYREQDMLAAVNRSLLEGLMVPRSDRESPAFLRDQIRSLGMYFADVVASERRLIGLYGETIQQFEARWSRPGR